MPGFDGTGPRSMGPMTGGAQGYCVLPAGGRFMRLGAGSGGRRTLGGFGRGRGMGRGFVRSRAISTFDSPYNLQVSEGNELGTLRQEAELIAGDLARVRARIETLEGHSQG
jgi:hypothetical protein